MEYVSAGPLGPLAATACLAFLFYVLTGLGAGVLSALRLRPGSWKQGEETLFSFGTGFVLFGIALLVLGLSGFFSRLFFLAAVLAAAVSAFFARPRFTFPPGGVKALGGAVFFALALSWLQAAAPPIGNDDLAYHLAHPRSWLLLGRITHFPDTYESLWPAQSGLYYALGLALQGASLAKFFHWIFYPLCALSAALLARRFAGDRPAALAALSFLFIPAAYAQSGHAYVDLAIAFFVTISFYLYILKDTMPCVRAALLSGIFMGGALATKQLALGPAAILACFWLAGSRRRFAPALVFGISAFVVAGAWYLRSWILAGNPVYPFFPQFFGGRGISMELRDVPGMGTGPLWLAALPFTVTFLPQKFGGEILGPVFLTFLPFAWTGKPRKERAETALFVFLCLLFLFTQQQRTRFFLMLAPLLCVGVGIALDRLLAQKGMIRWTATTVFTAMLALHSGIFLYRDRHALPFVAGAGGTVEAYLAKHERSYETYAWLADNAAAPARVFNAAEGRRFYGDPGLLGRMTWNGDSLWQALEREGRSLEAYLEEHAFEYVWTSNEPVAEIAGYLSREGYRPVFEARFVEGGFVTLHRVYRRPA